MRIEDYQDSVLKTIEFGTTLYPSMITDIHQLGVKLAKKYRMIRLSYLIFLYGIILSVFLFAACHTLFHTLFFPS